MTARPSARVYGLITVIALGYLLLMFNSGRPPTHENFIQSINDGVLELAPEKIVAVELSKKSGLQTYQRQSDGWLDVSNKVSLIDPQLALLQRAITFMHTATPVRIMRPEEFADVQGDPYGFKHPAIVVRLSSAAGVAMVAKFGNRANDGILQYLQIEGRAEIYLMSGFVGEAWDHIGRPDPETK